MNRHRQIPALVLRLHTFGESNREAAFLTPAEGIVRAAVYGGPKSKLRAYVSPFQTGTLYLYHDSVRGTDKVSDFDVSAWRPEIRELLERAVTAAFIARAVIAGSGGGAMNAAAFSFTNECLDALQYADADMCAKIHVHFLWNWLELLGLSPEINTPPPSGGEFGGCTGGGAGRGGEVWNAGTVRYLRLTEKLPPARLERFSLEAASFARLKAFLDNYWRETARNG